MMRRWHEYPLVGLLPLLLFMGLVTLILLATEYSILALTIGPMMIAAVIFFKHPELAYYGIIFAVPLNSLRALTEQYPFLTVSKLFGIAVLGILFLRHTVTKEPLFPKLKSRLWLPLGAFALANFISWIFSAWIPAGVQAIRQLITSFLVLGLTIYFIGPKQLKTTLPYVLVANAVISALMAIMGSWLGIDIFTEGTLDSSAGDVARATGAAGDPNYFGMALLVVIPLCIYFFFHASSKLRKVAWFGILSMISYAVMLTYSRSSILNFGIILMIMAWEFRHRFRVKYLGFMIPALAILLPVAVIYVPQTEIYDRMASLSEPTMDYSLMRRKSYLVVAKDSFLENPILGTGPGTFPFVYESSSLGYAISSLEKANARRMAHNTFIEILVGSGLFGLVAFFALMGSSLLFYHRAQAHAERIGLDPQLIRCLLYGFISALMSLTFISGVEHKYLWMFIGLGAALERITARSSALSDPQYTPEEVAR